MHAGERRQCFENIYYKASSSIINGVQYNPKWYTAAHSEFQNDGLNKQDPRTRSGYRRIWSLLFESEGHSAACGGHAGDKDSAPKLTQTVNSGIGSD